MGSSDSPQWTGKATVEILPSFGVFGYGGNAPLSWNWPLALFFIFLVVSVVGFLGGTLPRVPELQEVRVHEAIDRDAEAGD